MRHSRPIAWGCRLAISLVVGAICAGAQEQRPTFKAGANFIRVDVYPTRGGLPVDDLRAEDFEVREDGVPQTIASFEHIVLRPVEPGRERREPATAAQAEQLAAEARNRVFVVFLDVPHVSIEASRKTAAPLLRLLDRLLAPDDLLGVMMPGMQPGDVVLARKTEALEGLLRGAPWGQRSSVAMSDTEHAYARCYAVFNPERVQEMTGRAQERSTLESLRNLVDYLHVVREERKAILTVSEGWQLYRPVDLSHLSGIEGSDKREPAPEPPPITVGRGGTITTRETRASEPADMAACERDRLRLSAIDDRRYFEELIEAANAANASFYAIDPRGVEVFDTSLSERRAPGAPPVRTTTASGVTVTSVPGAPPSEGVDALQRRQDVLRQLAAGTDGIAVMNTDLDRGLKRISDDSGSYYLLGYASTNTKLDGKFRALKVRVTRPGIEVRARRGYRAATAAEMNAASTPAAMPAASPVAAAIARLDGVRADAALYVAAVPSPAAAGAAGVLWVQGELPAATTDRIPASVRRAIVDVIAEGASATAEMTLAADARGFLAPVTLPAAMPSGTVTVRVRLEAGDATTRESTRLELPSANGQPLFFRRGPTTGNRLQPAASMRFTRSERLHLEIPAAAGARIGAARLLDMRGQPLPIPLSTGERADEPSGQRWLTGDLALAPLGAGDYAIELTIVRPGGEQRVTAAFKLAR